MSYTRSTTGTDITATSTGASGQVLYTCPTNTQAEVSFLSISNSSSTAGSVVVELYDSSSTSYFYIVNNGTVLANSTFKPLGGDTVFLNAGDKLVVSKDAVTTLHAVVSVREYFNPQGA